MLQKVHLRLTILCTSITGILFVCMTFLYLLVAESNLKNNSYYSFERDVQSILLNLESQTVISYEWLSKLEADGKYSIFLEDNGEPLLYGNIVQNQNRTGLLNDIKKEYSHRFEIQGANSSSFTSYHQEFTYHRKGTFLHGNREEYYVSYGKIPKKNGFLEVYILCSLKDLYRQIYTQRLLFISINLVAFVALFFFFWYLTKRLLRPVRENQKKQTAFIAAASHELRTPLTVILSSVSALKKLSKEDTRTASVETPPARKFPSSNSVFDSEAELETFCNIVEGEANRMSRLVNDLLLLAKGDNQSYSVQLEETEAETLLLSCYEAFEPMARDTQIALSISLPENPMPPCKCDSQRIAQVLAIFVHNAISYTAIRYETPNSSGLSQPAKGKVTLKGEYKDKHHCFSVIDNGIGIPEEEKENIFERFYRVDTSRSKKDHFGLGLCIAQEIVREHGGSIQVLDTPGGGSTFVMRL